MPTIEHKDGRVELVPETTNKDEIVRRAKHYFINNNVLDLQSFINNNCPSTHREHQFVRDVAYKIVRDWRYKKEEIKETFLISLNTVDDIIWNKARWILPLISLTIAIWAFIRTFD